MAKQIKDVARQVRRDLQERAGLTDDQMEQRMKAARKTLAQRNGYFDKSGMWHQGEIDDGYCEPGCAICGGSGWVRNDLPRDHKDFGKLQPCPKRNPLSIYNLSNTGLTNDEIMGLDWGKLIPSESAKQLQAAIESTIKRGWGWIYLWGDYGTGKTLGLKIAVATMLRRGIDAAHTNMAEIIEDLRAAYDQDNPQMAAQTRLRRWRRFPLLAIDEFDRVRSTEFATEKQFSLMDDRYQSALREQSITLLAANVGPDQYDGYLRDRIEHGAFKVVKLTGESLRPGLDQSDRAAWDYTDT